MISEEIEDFFADRRHDDLLLLYFSCHGIKDDAGRLYFAGSNTKAQRLAATGISSVFVNEQIARSRSRRKVLLLDCCFSGAFAHITRADRAFTPQQSASACHDGLYHVMLLIAVPGTDHLGKHIQPASTRI